MKALDGSISTPTHNTVAIEISTLAMKQDSVAAFIPLRVFRLKGSDQITATIMRLLERIEHAC